MGDAAYIASTLGLLAFLALSFHLIGQPVLRWAMRGAQSNRAERWLLTLATGMGSAMALLAAAGAFGLLTRLTLAVIFGVALLANAVQWLAECRRAGQRLTFKATLAGPMRSWVAPSAAAGWAIALAALPVLVFAIIGPLGGDSYIYHLPQAREMADSGRLAVNEHLQVPLHPHYYHLLHASALLLWDDRLANALHAASAVLATAGIYYLGRIWVGRLAALIASALFALLATGIHSHFAVLTSAYVGYGTAVFTPFAYHCLARALTEASGRLLCLAGLLMGVSLGIKTQAWVGVPAFAALGAVAAWRIGRLGPVAGAGLAALLVGGFWYLRNFLVSGDPFHPLLGNWLGHWGWNAGDLAMMHQWLDERSGLSAMQWLLVAPALAMPLLVRAKGGVAPGLAFASCAGLVTWVVTSFHDRFLLSIAPVILLASGWVLVKAGQAVRRRLPAGVASLGWKPPEFSGAARRAVIAIGAAWAIGGVAALAVATRIVCGEVVCAARIDGVEAQRVLREFGHRDWLKIYELDLMHARWDIGRDVVGGPHGPARYRDLTALEGDGQAVEAHLRRFGRNALLVNTASERHQLPVTESFRRRFAACGRHGHVALYVLRQALAERSGPDWPPAACGG
ncbi:MAG: hypothetical protein OXU70_06220 [Gammaproteobacteria bacterium]|nr:hypothetical protein [Gammaproteobacteria bacterium]